MGRTHSQTAPLSSAVKHATPFNIYPIAIYLRRKRQREEGLFYFSVDKAPVLPFYRKALKE